MNAPYLIFGLLCGLAVGYAFGWQYKRRLRKLREEMAPHLTPTCFGGIRCSECPGGHVCGTGCYIQLRQEAADRQRQQEAADAARFRWLTEDHADPEQRETCRKLLERMARMSYSAACMSIDVHRGAA